MTPLDPPALCVSSSCKTRLRSLYQNRPRQPASTPPNRVRLPGQSRPCRLGHRCTGCWGGRCVSGPRSLRANTVPFPVPGPPPAPASAHNSRTNLPVASRRAEAEDPARVVSATHKPQGGRVLPPPWPRSGNCVLTANGRLCRGLFPRLTGPAVRTRTPLHKRRGTATRAYIFRPQGIEPPDNDYLEDPTLGLKRHSAGCLCQVRVPLGDDKTAVRHTEAPSPDETLPPTRAVDVVLLDTNFLGAAIRPCPEGAAAVVPVFPGRRRRAPSSASWRPARPRLRQPWPRGGCLPAAHVSPGGTRHYPIVTYDRPIEGRLRCLRGRQDSPVKGAGSSPAWAVLSTARAWALRGAVTGRLGAATRRSGPPPPARRGLVRHRPQPRVADPAVKPRPSMDT